jgi:hypothetical protein
MEKVLEETETSLERRGAVAEGALDGLPQRDFLMRQRHDADPAL